jgi:3-deoxy-alpha-D-manno-octulosonate 8-oxidase
MSNSILDTGIKVVKNVGGFNFGTGSLDNLSQHVDARRAFATAANDDDRVVYLVDEFFSDRPETLDRLGSTSKDRVDFVLTTEEPKTEAIDERVAELISAGLSAPASLVGVGGGTTLDTVKAVANLLTNGGKAEDFQGWDLVRVPGRHKIGVPTISGTGSESSRTCVMTNTASGLKLGMNSDYTVFDHLILDPELPATVPRDQYFYTGMDAYLHCVEALAGSYRNAVGDAYSRETLSLCRRVFLADDMMSPESRERLMVASYLGGCAIGTSYVGLVHPFSAGLSVVLGVHHCVANCIVMRAMAEFYPAACTEFEAMAKRQRVTIPKGVCHGLSDAQYRALYDTTVIHEKPLTNALGSGYREVLTLDKVVELFQAM